MKRFRSWSRWPRLELLEVITVGFPFCAFKVFTGLIILKKYPDHPLAWGVGSVLVTLGILDFLINAVNLVALLLQKKRWLNACCLDFGVSRVFGWPDLGSSLDVLLSFVLVALVVGMNWLDWLSSEQMHLWNLCVVFNVLGAGLSRLSQSLKQGRAAVKGHGSIP